LPELYTNFASHGTVAARRDGVLGERLADRVPTPVFLVPVEDQSGHRQNGQHTEPLGGFPRKRFKRYRFLGHGEIRVQVEVLQGLLRGEDGELEPMNKKVGEGQTGVHEEIQRSTALVVAYKVQVLFSQEPSEQLFNGESQALELLWRVDDHHAQQNIKQIE